MPKVSVIMPVFNNETFLRESIESILQQTYRDFEFIIVCEYGSNIASVKIIEEYASLDDRVQIISNNTKLNIAASLNAGLDIANGEYIARMDADDVSLKERLAIQVDFLDIHEKIGICATDVYFIDKQGLLLNLVDPYPHSAKQIKSDLLFYCCLRHSSVMMRRSAILEAGLRYNPDYSATEDFDFWNNACQSLDIVRIPNKLLLYRWHRDNATYTHNEQGVSNYLSVMNTNFLRFGLHFSRLQLHSLCTLTCKLTLRNVFRTLRFIHSASDEIKKRNQVLNLYDSECLDLTLKKRMFWHRSPWRLVVSVSIRAVSWILGNFSKKISFALDRAATYLEIHGIKKSVKRVFNKKSRIHYKYLLQ